MNVSPREFRKLWPEFQEDSWTGWNSVEDAIFGLPPEDPDLVLRLTGRDTLPSEQLKEAGIVAGRGEGKSRQAGRTGTYMAAGREYRRAPGERIYGGLFAPDRRQAGIIFGYVRGLFAAVPALESMIERETKDSIDLDNGVTIEVITSSKAAPRGRSYCFAIIDEACFLPSEDAADPDVELLRALRPALARVPGSLLLLISSPYSRRGELYRMWKTFYGVDDPDSMVVVSPTGTLNPTFDRREIDRAYKSDPASAEAEYGAAWRSDVSALLTEEALSAVVVDVREIPPDAKRKASAHFDAATGSGSDSAALAIAYAGKPAELAAIRRWKPPFSPSAIIQEASELLEIYGLTSITIDRYAPGLVADLFKEHGISAKVADLDTSAGFVELLGLINSTRIRLLDDPVLLSELRRLERKPGGAGRDRVGHPPGAHDDVAAAASGALIAATKRPTRNYSWGPGRRRFHKFYGSPPNRQRKAKPPETVRFQSIVEGPDGKAVVTEVEGTPYGSRHRGRSPGHERVKEALKKIGIPTK